MHSAASLRLPLSLIAAAAFFVASPLWAQSGGNAPAKPDTPALPAEKPAEKPADKTPAKPQPFPSEPGRDALERDAVPYEQTHGPGESRLKVFPQTLFDGENLRPYERRWDSKSHALLGSWSVGAHSSWYFGGTAESRDGFDIGGRVRYGFIGADLSFLGITGRDDHGPRTQNVQAILSVRGTLDADMCEWLTLRPVLGWASVDSTNDRLDDDGMIGGIEADIFPYKPFALYLGAQSFQTKSGLGWVHDLHAAIGVFPLMFVSRSESNNDQQVYPEIRIGWRRIESSKGGFLSISAFEVTLAVEF
jgi:hypothetical protein